MANSDSQTLSQFITGDKQFEIPPYQRNYSWEEQQVDDLWADLIEAVEMDRDHYIGTFLLMKEERDDGTVHEIIDGQQRITTLTILLFELQEILDEYGEETTARKIRGEYVARYGTQKLTLAGDDKIFFKREILENVSDDDRSGQNEITTSDVSTESPSQARLLETKHILRRRLAKGAPEELSHESPADFYTDLYDMVKSLPLLEYTVNSRSEAARIFQTVNDRGKDLTALEITKSYLMHRVSLLEEGSKADDLIGSIQAEFSKIYQSIEDISGPGEDQIQRYHFIVWNTDWTTGWDSRYYQKHLEHVKDYFRSVGDADEVMEYVYELQSMFDRLDALINYEDRIDSPVIKDRLENLFIAGRLGNFYPLLMVAYDKYEENQITENQFCILLQRVETFIVRTYIIEQKSADTGRSRAYPLARSLYYSAKSNVPDSVNPLEVAEVNAKLERHINNYCDDEQLESTLGNTDVYRYYSGSKRLKELRLLLYAYEASLEREKENLQFDLDMVVSSDNGRISIEHVWPQKPSDDLDEERKSFIEEHKHRLGNLALMTREDNAAKGNDPFRKKKEGFDGSKFRMLEEIFEKKDWNVDRIEVREEAIIKEIRENWPDEYESKSA